MSSATLPSLRPVTIATHSGKFHCDEVLGTVMLDKILGGSKNYSTRDGSLRLLSLEGSDIIIPPKRFYTHDSYRCSL